MANSLDHPERPIGSSADDELGRDQFVRRLTDALINPNSRKSTGVVVGITGPWGSGKSSVLNLLGEHIRGRYSDALVVRFDPWLVSGRNDLIAEFMSELLAAIRAEPKLRKRLKGLIRTVSQYGSQLSSAASIVNPWAGTIVSAVMRTVDRILGREYTLVALREKLTAQLGSAAVPVVMLIDELDRVEDPEVKTVAQLVRSVADFPGISYVLAYDQARVIEALGADAPPDERIGRGRAYLEKIVQLQIPLPVTFGEEIDRLLAAELGSLRSEVGFPESFTSNERFKKLNEVLTQDLVATPRDIKRLIGTLHVIGGMVRGEVDPIDLLAYCALLIKAPQTVQKLRSDPELIVDDTQSVRAASRRMAWDKRPVHERVSLFVPEEERTDGVTRLLSYLFPAFREPGSGEESHPDRLSLRRPLLSALRLGLVPGTFARSEIEAFVARPAEAETVLRNAAEQDKIAALIDRFDDVYVDLPTVDHAALWSEIGRFLRKRDRAWMTSFQPMHETVRAFAAVISHALKRQSTFRRIDAARIFERLKEEGEISLVSHLLRHHMFIFGLYDCREEGGDDWFLTKEQAKQNVEELSRTWKTKHLSGDLLPSLWDLMPVYTMVSAGAWDDECRGALDALLAADNRVVDALSLLFYGGHYTVGTDTVQNICSYEQYVLRVRQRLASAENLHESLRTALDKAAKGGWP